MRKVYKYATGETVPNDATYLCTKVQTEEPTHFRDNDTGFRQWQTCWLVWHYFLVDVEE